MSDRAEFYVMGQPFDGEPLHYTASGLDYVYLQNGFSVEEDPDYGRIVTIDAPDDLHKAIGLYVITEDRCMTAAEFRFLRKQMGFTQSQLAERFGTDVQTIANYEKGKKIPRVSEELMRVTFALWLMPPDARGEVIKQIADEIQRRKEKRKIQRPPYKDIARGWQAAEACA